MFTVEEANALLPWLRALLPRLRDARQVVFRAAERIRETAPADGGGAVGQEYWDAVTTLRRGLEELSERSIILRDPESGLVDFPSVRDGEPVLLCWRLGEDRIGFWHEPQSGFAGRRSL